MNKLRVSEFLRGLQNEVRKVPQLQHFVLGAAREFEKAAYIQPSITRFHAALLKLGASFDLVDRLNTWEDVQAQVDLEARLMKQGFWKEASARGISDETVEGFFDCLYKCADMSHVLGGIADTAANAMDSNKAPVFNQQEQSNIDKGRDLSYTPPKPTDPHSPIPSVDTAVPNIEHPNTGDPVADKVKYDVSEMRGLNPITARQPAQKAGDPADTNLTGGIRNFTENPIGWAGSHMGEVGGALGGAILLPLLGSMFGVKDPMSMLAMAAVGGLGGSQLVPMLMKLFMTHGATPEQASLQAQKEAPSVQQHAQEQLQAQQSNNNVSLNRNDPGFSHLQDTLQRYGSYLPERDRSYLTSQGLLNQ
jgi:hypothetical protein